MERIQLAAGDTNGRGSFECPTHQQQKHRAASGIRWLPVSFQPPAAEPSRGSRSAEADSPADAGSAKPSENGARRESRLSARNSAAAKALLSSVRGKETSAEAWDTAFQNAEYSSEVLAEAVLQLHSRKQYPAVVECLLSSLRNDHANSWTYDVLANAMKLAGRPAAEIDRVLQSRIDFTPGDTSQMMLAAAMLSRFDADVEALRICRRAAETSPEVSQIWLFARSIADQSGVPEEQAWARLGILRYVWDDGYATHHQEALKVIQDVLRKLEADGNVNSAAAIREELSEATTVDLRIRILWSGTADLDLMVEEPDGEQCSYRNRMTRTAGRLVTVDSGGVADAGRIRMEEYVCRTAESGNYGVTLRFVTGKAVAGTAVLEIIQHQNSPAETKTQKKLTLGDKDILVPVVLESGRSSRK